MFTKLWKWWKTEKPQKSPRIGFRPSLEALAGWGLTVAPRARPPCQPRLEALEARIVPATLHHWTDSSGDGLASTAANWDSGPIAAGDSLIFDAVSGPRSNDAVTFDANFTAAVASFTIAGTYSGAVNVNASLNLSAGLMDGSAQGSLNVAANQILSANQCSFSACTVNGPGALQVQDSTNSPGSLTVGNSTTLSALQVSTGALSQFTIQGAVSFVQGCTVTTIGPTSWTGGQIALQNNSIISNLGTWTVTCDQSMTGTPGSSFQNLAAFTKNATPNVQQTGQTSLLLAFSSAPTPNYPLVSPTVTVNSGTIEFSTDANQAGQFSTSTAGALLFDSGTQTFTGNTQFSGLGSVTVSNIARWLANSSASVIISCAQFNQSGSTIIGGLLDPTQGPATYSISSTFNWTGGTIRNTNATITGAWNITGAPAAAFGMYYANVTTWGQTTWDATQDIAMLGSSINNYGTFQLKSGQTMSDAGNPPTDPYSSFSNDDDGQGHVGTVTKLAGLPSTFSVIFNNSGQLLLNGLSVNFTAQLSQSGANSVTNLGGGVLTTSSPFNITGGQLIAPGTIKGTLNLSGALLFSGSIGILTVTGDFTEANTASITLRIGGNQANQYDQINVGGTANLNGQLHLNLINNFTPAATDTFKVLTAGVAVNGTWAVDAGWLATYNPLNVTLKFQAMGGGGIGTPPPPGG